jgi:Ser/Thr protein kinase RdoA (MazF antagonist)
LQAINRETDVGVPEPIADASGEHVITVTSPEIPGEWHCVLFSWIPGTLLAKRWTRDNIERYGRLSAMLHMHGRSFAPPKRFRIRRYSDPFPHCNPVFVNPEPLVLFDEPDEDLMPPERRSIFRSVCNRVQQEIDRLFDSGTPQPIHNDLHPWNVMVWRDRLYAIDFENCLNGFPIQDVGTTLHYIQQHFGDKIPFETCLAAFRRGYESVRTWPEERPGQIEAMMAAHRLLLCNFYAASRDPEYREFAVGFLERMERRFRCFLEDSGEGG